ncbi:signal peptidase I SipW [Bacillus sp. AFS053548]|uniref:signal peptidase I SipW n=1 Tax=Bacillus sp. AFS053548 TaxID=2033505 RepID=UPI000BFB5E0A|nr:signal peptidase I [Bacillus sp. AFS053548]PGM48851.1 signal peptidase I [Bacillus sp. AFS053548]
MKKLVSILINLIKLFCLVILCFMAFIVLSSKITGQEPTIRGYQLKTVLSGSMEPIFQTGSIIQIKLEPNNYAYQKGDIITFHTKDRLVTHRILEVKNKNGEITYKTKGDNNNGPDLWIITQRDVIGKYTGITIPYLGYVMNYANSKIGSTLLLIIPGILLIISALYSIISAKKELEIVQG